MSFKNFPLSKEKVTPSICLNRPQHALTHQMYLSSGQGLASASICASCLEENIGPNGMNNRKKSHQETQGWSRWRELSPRQGPGHREMFVFDLWLTDNRPCNSVEGQGCFAS